MSWMLLRTETIKKDSVLNVNNSQKCETTDCKFQSLKSTTFLCCNRQKSYKNFIHFTINVLKICTKVLDPLLHLTDQGLNLNS